MCIEGLHGLINKAATNGEIHDVSICRNGARLTHLLFAEDSLFFCRATENECQTLLNNLAKYERASGQQINRAKTTLFFSKSTKRGPALITMEWACLNNTSLSSFSKKKKKSLINLII